MSRFPIAARLIRPTRRRKQQKQDANMFNQLLTALSTTLAGLTEWLQELTGGGETDLHSHAGGGGGDSGVLEDPGEVFTPNTVVTEGHRIAETIDGELRVFEATSAGTTHPTAESLSEFTVDLTPLGVTNGGAVDWRYLGIVGQLPWDVVPRLDAFLLEDDQGPTLVGTHPWDDPDTIFRILPALADPGTPWEAALAVSAGDRVTATVDGRVRVFHANATGDTGATEPAWLVSVSGEVTSGDGDISWAYLGVVGGPDREHPVFSMNSAGDADYYLDSDQGSGFRWNVAVNGVIDDEAGNVEITTDGFKVYTPTESFDVRFDPFSISMVGLPTADPAVAGRLWNSSGTLKVSAG